MTMEFDSWTAYDDWLIEHYDTFAVYDVHEENGKISVSCCSKEEWREKQKNAGGN